MANKPKTAQKVDTKRVSKVDVCQTPPHALEPLYEHIDRMGYKIIWESAVGPEAILENALANKGYTVHGTDLMYGDTYNRFTYKPVIPYDIEITNMPFSIKYKWLEKAFSDGKPFALLAPYETSFAKDFQSLHKEYNNKPWRIEILSPERRINFKMPNMGWGTLVYSEEKGWYMSGESAQMPTVWITWGLEVHTVRNDPLLTFYVPMRSVKYNADNTEKESHGKNKRRKNT